MSKVCTGFEGFVGIGSDLIGFDEIYRGIVEWVIGADCSGQ